MRWDGKQPATVTGVLKMHRSRLFCAVTIIVAWAGSLKCQVDNTKASAEAKAAAVLIPQFETVAKTSTDILSTVMSVPANQINNKMILRLPFVQLAAGLNALSPTALAHFETHYYAVFVGAKNFMPPEGLGMVSSQDCYIALLQGSEASTLSADFAKANRQQTNGEIVWTWSMPPYEGNPRSTTFYATEIGTSYLVLSNSWSDFEAVKNSLESAAIPTPVMSPHDLNGLHMYKYWMRRSTHNEQTAGLPTLAKQVIGLTFVADIDKNEGRLQAYLSEAVAAKDIARILPIPGLAWFKTASPPLAWEAVIPLEIGKAGQDALYQVFDYFGFGVAA
jgi:hypothetical protein